MNIIDLKHHMLITYAFSRYSVAAAICMAQGEVIVTDAMRRKAGRIIRDAKLNGLIKRLPQYGSHYYAFTDKEG